MILNQTQAKAVFDAQCAANSINARFTVVGEDFYATEDKNGEIVILDDLATTVERYPSQAAFVAAYCLT
jgi:hypothetical protein